MAAPSFTFDGKTIPITSGDTVGSALHRAGVKVLSRSLKYHRPRGLYCCTGSCASCLVDIDGVPNLPACMQPAKDGQAVVSQNRIGSAKHDLLGVVDKVYRKGFDPHGAFTKPAVLNQAFLKGVRFMSGLGKAPGPKAPTAVPQTPRRSVLQVDELVIGGGREGLTAVKAMVEQQTRAPAQTKARTKRRILVVDELDSMGGSARWDASETDTRRLVEAAPDWPGVELWSEALCFGLYPHSSVPGAMVAGVRRGDDLVEVHAPRITVATGRHDAWPVFENNDLPGVLSLRGARRLLGEHHVLPGKRVVVHGASLPEAFAADLEAHGATVVATGTVDAVRGGLHVDAARIAGAWTGCDAVVCNLPGTPRVELLQQAGCELAFDDDGVLAPRVAGDGTTTRNGVRAAFSKSARVHEGPTPRTKRTPDAAASGPGVRA